MHRLIVSRPLIPSNSQLSDETERNHYWAALTSLLHVPARQRRSSSFFPGCNPRSISRQSSECLRTHEYRICLKSDGVRYLLFLTTRKNDPDGAVALMIDRCRHMYEVEVAAPSDYFVRGSLFEGELVWKQPEETVMVYHVFDALVVKGETLCSKPFCDRLEAVTKSVRLSNDLRELEDVDAQVLQTDSVVMMHYSPYIEMRPKHFVSICHADRLWSERVDMGHRVDGIILQDVHAPYKFGTATDDSCLKWKEHSSIDLMGPSESLCASDGPLPDKIHGRNVCVLASRIEGSNAQIIEYMVTTTQTDVNLMAMRTRPDKASANSLHVVEATIADVIHTMDPSELASESRIDMAM